MRHHEMNDEDDSPDVRRKGDANALRGHLKEAKSQGTNDNNFK